VDDVSVVDGRITFGPGIMVTASGSKMLEERVDDVLVELDRVLVVVEGEVLQRSVSIN